MIFLSYNFEFKTVYVIAGFERKRLIAYLTAEQRNNFLGESLVSQESCSIILELFYFSLVKKHSNFAK